MVAKVFKNVSQIIENYSGLSRKVLDYSVTVKGLADECKQPGFQNERWDQLFSEFFDTKNFQRIGHLKEVMGYPAYIEFQTKWAPISQWECSFKRITEKDNVVFLELEERATVQGHTNVVNTLSVYEFNESGKIRYIDVYLQQTPQTSEVVPDAYK
jgi:hypothetical protein